MSHNLPLPSPAGAPDASAMEPLLERNRYFTGKYMTARDFRTDPEYFLNRHRFHQRLLHGWGVVYGLRVKRHRGECADRWVIVEPGVAIDCLGREIILKKMTPIDLGAQLSAYGNPGAPGQSSAPKSANQAGTVKQFLLCLRYNEILVEFVPALYSDDNTDPTHKEANRIQEDACLELIPLEEAGPDCWRSKGDDPKAYVKEDCDTPTPGVPCTEGNPTCPCRGMVPLALVEFTQEATGEPHLTRIDIHGRRRLAVAPDNLTHIVKINWPHGGQLTLSKLRELGGKLTIHFDRTLLLPEDEKSTAWGINERTFVVQYGGVQRALEFLDGTVTLDNDDHSATFAIKQDFLNQPQKIAYNTIYIVLKCDFILDCHGEPVDGNFLGGRLPSGNGTAGGLFESWFEVLPDHSNSY